MKITIAQKMSNSGSIDDIASDQYDREILGPGKFAVVLSSYYLGRGYTTHKTAAAAITCSKKLARGNWSHIIIDGNGTVYAIHSGYYEDELEAVGNIQRR